MPVDAEGWLEFCVRTWDSSNNTEPTFVRSAWKYVRHLVALFRNLTRALFLQLGPARHLVLPPYQGVQRQPDQTRYRTPS